MKPVQFISLLLVLFLLTSCDLQLAGTASAVHSANRVHLGELDGKYQLIKGGQPFRIKGASGDPQYIQALAEAGGNCLRVYDTIGLAKALDMAQQFGITIIADLPIPKSRYLEFYNDEAQVSALLHAYQNVVREHKDHPALLMWVLGNELDFPYRPAYSPFYNAYNNILAMIKQEDGEHPVATALTNFQRRTISNIRMKIPDLDLLGINTFGLLKNLENDMAEFAWMWDGPYFVSEWSINGYWEVPKTAWEAPLENAGWKKQEELFRRYYENMPNDDPRFLGHCFFYWGHKQEVTATWFNAFTASGQPTYLYSAYALLNEDSHAYNPAPKVKYMLVNKGGGADHVILKPNEKYEAEIILDSPLDSTLKVNWSLCSEDWYSLELSSEAPPVAYLDHLLLKDEKVRIEFQAPEQEGPYRIYASLNYPGSITATVNTPIYVIE